jgi:predicted ester cyclase
MAGSHLDTIRAYYEATEAGNWEAAGSCVGPGYVWIDHGTGVVAHTGEELLGAQADAAAWSDTRFDITEAYETSEGTAVVQVVQSCNVTGPWRSMETTGQRISFPFCAIFRFDADGLIVHEEQYYDMSSVRQQLGS